MKEVQLTDVQFLRSLALGISNVEGYGFNDVDVARVRSIADNIEKVNQAAQKTVSSWAEGGDFEALTPHIETLEVALWDAGVATR